mmetsp:Transcript_10056/g.30084  ORF Transcript_10056/g.30084 Transcript_10056/m.30084 type:complete len:233 (-) Transcript_10056:25-723(-)
MAEKNPKGAVNVVRRTWDVDKYEQKAKDREEYGDEHVDGTGEDQVIRNRQEFKPAEEGAAGPAGSKRSWLKHREKTFGFEKQAGSTKVLTEPEVQKRATGWYCDVCECLLRDSAAYLDHVNGKKHQRKLGYSMRTERVCVDVVRARLEKKTEERKEAAAFEERRKHMDVGVEYATMLEEREADAAAEKEAKRERKRQRKEEEAKKAEEEDPNFDAEMNAMMGFGGFGGGKKR